MELNSIEWNGMKWKTTPGGLTQADFEGLQASLCQ